jgi:type I restriction enzyme S subunit
MATEGTRCPSSTLADFRNGKWNERLNAEHLTAERPCNKATAPPRSEQERIADALDELLSDLDAGVEALRRAQAKLGLYRASVFKAAVQGDLSAEWRRQNPNAEPASFLLQRILTERRQRWGQEQLRKFAAAGKTPPAKWKTKYKEPVRPDTTDLPELPEGWCWASVDQLSLLVTDGDHNPPKRTQNGIPHLTAKNVKNLNLNKEDCTYISVEDSLEVFKRYAPCTRDIIITCVGTIGRVAIVPENFIFSADRNLAALRLVCTGSLVELVLAELSSPRLQDVMKSISGSTAQPHLYLGDIKTLSIALPPASEQQEVLQLLAEQLSVVDHLGPEIEQRLNVATALRQSILRHAFAGQLVPQDPNDEPADELLKRIATEREFRVRAKTSPRKLATRRQKREK